MYKNYTTCLRGAWKPAKILNYSHYPGHDLLRRNSSSSSASSSDSGFMSGDLLLQTGNQGLEEESNDKKLKRREQVMSIENKDRTSMIA